MAPTKIPDDLIDALLDCVVFREARETGSYWGTFTPEEHLERFRKLDSEYRASSCAKNIEDLLRSKKPADGWPIDNALAFGLGTFSYAIRPVRTADYFKQLASFLHVVEIRKLCFPAYLFLPLLIFLDENS